MAQTAPLEHRGAEHRGAEDRAAEDRAAEDHFFEGRRVTLPVAVRDAANWSAQYLVPRAAAQAIVAPTGLEVAEPVPGRALLALAFVRYEDTDLDRYHEVAVSFVVRPPRRGAGRPGSTSARGARAPSGRRLYIHQLPVDQTFTMAAGAGIWGYPKFLAEIDIDEDEQSATCRLEHGGEHVLHAAGGQGRTAAHVDTGHAHLHLARRRAPTDRMEHRRQGARRSGGWSAAHARPSPHRR